MRKWIGLVIAAAMVCNVAVIATPARAAPTAEDRRFEAWVTQVMDLTAEASAVSETFTAWSNQVALVKTQEERLAFARTSAPQFREATAKLAAIRARFDAIPAYRNGSEEQMTVARLLLKDGKDYTDRMMGVFASVEELLAGVIADDPRRIAAAGPRLKQAAIVLLEGQMIILEGRRSLYGRDDPGYYEFGMMLNLYEGMRAVLYARLDLIEKKTAISDLRTGARRCREAVAAGRPVVERAYAEARLPGERAYFAFDRQLMGIGAETATTLDRIADVLENSSGEVAFRELWPSLVDLEDRFIDTMDKQMHAVT